MFFHVPDRLLLQDVLDWQDRHAENIGYCLATRVRTMIYYETARDLQCTGAGNYYTRAKYMVAAMNVFAGKGKRGNPDRDG